jgi:carbon monoxide dehydrogenase subunit G
MANLTIHERFELDAPPETVWTHLVDPERIVVCLPGAELLGQDDERTYEGTIKVSVGAITVGYRGKVVFEEIDADERFVRIKGRGREKAGSGTAMLTMESRVSALEGGRSEVTVDAEVKLAGKIVRFGRGMIETISTEIFSEFTSRLQALLAEDTASSAGEAGSAPETAPAQAGEPAESLALIPLLFRAMKRWLAGIFGRA